MAAVATGAAAGLFGNGPLSARQASERDLTVHYPRFSRAQAPLVLAVEWLPQQQDAELWIERAYLERFQIDEILPSPTAVSVDEDRVYYTFRAREPAARVGARFRLKPEHGGMISGRIGSDRELAIEVRQFVFP